MTSEKPTLRWGIIGTGMIASWFVTDLTTPRKNPLANHKITAIGSSTAAKALSFASTHLPNNNNPTQAATQCYGSYAEVYASPSVDIIYIATPHALHLRNALEAISAGKHVLVEKPMALNAAQAAEMIAAARQKGVFLMEGMWTRFMPLTRRFVSLLHEQKAVGDVRRAFCDFGLDMPIQSLPATSRLRDPGLGAGSLLDIGIYSLTWGVLALEAAPEAESERDIPSVVSAQTLEGGVDVMSSMVLFYPSTGRQGILTSTTMAKSDNEFCRVEGTKGIIVVSGETASMPESITILRKRDGAGQDMGDKRAQDGEDLYEKKTLSFEVDGDHKGFCYEADAVAIDIAAGRTESRIMPLNESFRMLDIMDGVRKQGGAHFPQDSL
ncbi:NAD(P)-binding protein [Cadophora sp. DSE1049]|nr:NAD(P)-binding protein [Cadophora sp. DSE1049]